MTERKKFTSDFTREAVRLMESSSKSNNLQGSYASAVYNKRLASHERCHWGCQKKSRVGNILGFSPPAERVGPRVSTFNRASGGVDSARRYGVSSNLKRPQLEG